MTDIDDKIAQVKDSVETFQKLLADEGTQKRLKAAFAALKKFSPGVVEGVLDALISVLEKINGALEELDSKDLQDVPQFIEAGKGLLEVAETFGAEGKAVDTAKDAADVAITVSTTVIDLSEFLEKAIPQLIQDLNGLKGAA